MLVVPPVLFLPLLDQNVCCKKDPGIVARWLTAMLSCLTGGTFGAVVNVSR